MRINVSTPEHPASLFRIKCRIMSTQDPNRELDPEPTFSSISTVKLTPYAERYGHSTHAIYAGTGKSGITPEFPPLDIQPLSKEERERLRIIDRVQRNDMSKYTSWELRDAGAIVDGNVDLNGLVGCKIHSFYQRSRWIGVTQETMRGRSEKVIGDPVDIGGGFEGQWLASNPIVWEALVPCLQLASLVWTNTHHWKW